MENHRLASPEAERAVIGVILLDNAAVESLDFLKSEVFYEPINRILFERIRNLRLQGFAGTKESLLREVVHDPDLSSRDPRDLAIHLDNCLRAGMVTMDHIGLSRSIVDKYLKRELVRLNNEAITTVYTSDDTAMGIIEEEERKLYNLAAHGDYRKDFVGFESLTADALVKIEHNYKNKKAMLGVTTGLTDLDNLLGGLQPSDLLIIAGRPSMGKTALAVNIALNSCEALSKEDKSVGFFSLEMSAEQLTNRIISMKTGINAFNLRSGRITQKQYDQIIRSRELDLTGLKLFIDDTPGLSVASLQSRARKLASKQNVGAIFVDYLQLLKGINASSSNNRVHEISEITQGLKNLAKEINVPVIALSQLSRAVEQRDDKRPLLSDLRESGSIEQDADVVMFIYREEYYTLRSQPKEGTHAHKIWSDKILETQNQAEVIVAKQRNGPIGNVKLYYNSRTTLFENLAIDK